MIEQTLKLYDRYFENCLFPEDNRIDEGGINLVAAIYLSWPIKIIQAAISFGFSALFLWLFLDFNYDNLLFFSIQLTPFYGSLFAFFSNLCLGVIFFPLGIFFSYYYWKIAFKLILYWLGRREDQMGEELYAASLSSHIFTIIPLFGGVLQSLAFFFLLLKGVKVRLNLSPFSSFLVVLFPYLLFIILFVITLVLLAMLMIAALG